MLSTKMKTPLLPIPEEGPIDFTKRIRNISVRYLNSQEPKKDDLSQWIVLPLYQKRQDLPCDDDGKTSILLAHIDVLRQLLLDYDKKMLAEEMERKKKAARNETLSKYLEEELQIQDAADELDTTYLEEGEILDYP